jgi:hypothetical protein
MTIMSDGHRQSFPVGPGKYKSALFLLYLFHLNGSQPFALSDEFRRLMGEYYGRRIVADAATPETKHTLVRALLGELVFMELELLPGYRNHLASSRSPQEIVDLAWSRRDTLTPDSPESFLRQALRTFFEQYENGTLVIAKEANSPWPTEDWADRALELKRRLNL